MQWSELKFGSVIFCKDFEFTDGGKSDKLFIVVGIRPLYALIAITTSQPPKPDISAGCVSQRNLFLNKKNSNNKLDKDTYVLLNKLGILNPTMMQEKCWQEAKVVLTLPEHEIHAIKNCAAYSNDIAPVYKSLLGPSPAAKK